MFPEQEYEANANDPQTATEFDSALPIQYATDRYQQYDTANLQDTAKKWLEKDLVNRALEQMQIFGGRSLDVGCATGRYPIFFAELGFHVTGIDKDAAAISICRAKTVHLSNVRFMHKDVLSDLIPVTKYDVATCMMGTWNHVLLTDQPKMAETIFQAIKRNGTFFVSSWNPESFFPGYLEMYSRGERDTLRTNAPTRMEMRCMLENVGFSSVDIVPFALFPDECYFAWEIREERLVALERSIRGRNPGLDANSQMYLAIATK